MKYKAEDRKRKVAKVSVSSSKARQLKVVKAKPLRALKLVEHRHTGKLVHHRHTSHLALIVILVITGFFLYISKDIVLSAQQKNSSLSVTLVVPGEPPATGAQITQPASGTEITNSSVVSINGTCAKNTFVTVYNNGNLVGSTNCTVAGIFQLDIQLVDGQNILSSLNFDNLNQPGPDTNAVILYYMNESARPGIADPSLPFNPAIITGVIRDNSGVCVDNDPNILSNCETQYINVERCEDYKNTAKLLTGGEPRTTVICVPRFVNVDEEKSIGLLVWGGSPPYAVNIKWGDSDTQNTLLSVLEPRYVSTKIEYAVLGVYNIKVLIKDANGQETLTETGIEVSGPAKPQNFIEYVGYSLHLSWFETPVPMYLVTVALTLGFWGGDAFDRYYGARKIRKSP